MHHLPSDPWRRTKTMKKKKEEKDRTPSPTRMLVHHSLPPRFLLVIVIHVVVYWQRAPWNQWHRGIQNLVNPVTFYYHFLRQSYLRSAPEHQDWRLHQSTWKATWISCHRRGLWQNQQAFTQSSCLTISGICLVKFDAHSIKDAFVSSNERIHQSGYESENDIVLLQLVNKHW